MQRKCRRRYTDDPTRNKRKHTPYIHTEGNEEIGKRKYTNIETRMTRSNTGDTRKAQKQKLKTRNQQNTKGCSQDS